MDEEWGLRLEEVRRRVDYQISQHDSYQRQAALFFRISIATIGIVIGLGRPLNVAKYLEEVFQNLSLQDNMASLIGSLSLNSNLHGLAELIILMVVIGTGVMIVFFLWEIGVRIPRSAYQAAYPNSFKPNAEAPLNHGPTQSIEHLKKSNFIEYQEIIEENDEEINKTKNHLQSAFNGARNGILAGLVTFVSIFALISGEPSFQLIASILITVISLEIFGEKYVEDRHWEYVKPRISAEGALFLGAILFAFALLPPWKVEFPILIAGTITAAVPFLGLYLEDESEILISTVRISLLALLFWGILVIHDALGEYASSLFEDIIFIFIFPMMILVGMNFLLSVLIWLSYLGFNCLRIGLGLIGYDLEKIRNQHSS